MVNPQKASDVAELTEQFRQSNGVVLTDYRGLTVKQLQELRRSLSDSATYAISKNTLTKIAAKQAGVELDESLLIGPTAIAFVTGDAVETAKGLRDFGKANPNLIVKGGFLEGKSLGVDDIKAMADLESREALLGKLASGMKASLSNAASLFNAPLSKVARAASALEDKAGQDSAALAGANAAEAPAEEASSTSKGSDDNPDAGKDESPSQEQPAED